MANGENKRFIECGDDRFEIISRARKHIIEATNIEMVSKEMEVLDNFLFRCWQMGWLKNDFHQLEKENAELKAKLKGFENGDVAWQGDMDNTIKQNLELKEQIEKMKCCGNCKNEEFTSAHEEPCLHCRRCFASKDVKDQENVKDNWEWEKAE